MADGPVLDPDSMTPLYVQVADYVAGRIEARELAPGSRLPAERDLAEQWGVAYATIRRAMAELRARGLVASVVGKGTYITGRG